MTDALAFEAFSSEYVAHLILARERRLPEPSPLQLMRRQDWLELELPPADLSAYDEIKSSPMDKSSTESSSAALARQRSLPLSCPENDHAPR